MILYLLLSGPFSLFLFLFFNFYLHRIALLYSKYIPTQTLGKGQQLQRHPSPSLSPSPHRHLSTSHSQYYININAPSRPKRGITESSYPSLINPHPVMRVLCACSCMCFPASGSAPQECSIRPDRSNGFLLVGPISLCCTSDRREDKVPDGKSPGDGTSGDFPILQRGNMLVYIAR